MILKIMTDYVEVSITRNEDKTRNMQIAVKREDGTWATANLTRLWLEEIKEFIDVISRMK